MKPPDMSKVRWSKEQQERFREAILYARQAMADPEVCAHYEKLGKKVVGSLSVWRCLISLRGRIY